jgi:hypothetical protein
MVLVLLRRAARKNVEKMCAPRKFSRASATIKNLRLARAQMSSATCREFALLLSTALRTYIRAAYELPASRITSEEIVNGLLANAKNDLSVIGLFSEILKLTDSVKYSQRKLSMPQQKGIYKKTCRAIAESERFFRKQKHCHWHFN